MIWQMIEDWFRGILTDGILSNLSGLFDSSNLDDLDFDEDDEDEEELETEQEDEEV